MWFQLFATNYPLYHFFLNRFFWSSQIIRRFFFQIPISCLQLFINFSKYLSFFSLVFKNRLAIFYQFWWVFMDILFYIQTTYAICYQFLANCILCNFCNFSNSYAILYSTKRFIILIVFVYISVNISIHFAILFYFFVKFVVFSF